MWSRPERASRWGWSGLVALAWLAASTVAAAVEAPAPTPSPAAGSPAKPGKTAAPGLLGELPLSSSDEPILISPEIYIEKLEENDDEYVIYFADDGSPRLRVSAQYQQMLSQGVSNETKSFIREKMRSAVDLLRNIEHRRQTIYKVVESIVQRQKDFLDHGVQHIKPMMLKDIAEDIGMHLSTVSRVVNRKYAHTPQGVIELRRFFTEGMLNEDGEEISTRIIKLQIKKLIEEEDSHNPITDDQVVKILAKDGIKLSRRTVAKYRDQMQIPGSRERPAVV